MVIDFVGSNAEEHELDPDPDPDVEFVFLLALLFGASELRVDGLFSHRFKVNFLLSVGVYNKQGMDVMVPFILSYTTSFVFVNFFCSRQ